ncbi:MAG: hypothetical protein Q4C48_07610 [Lachnospiraceae bacterium]|nr:hypothetical protein [Lachnospiraceae bacterium]
MTPNADRLIQNLTPDIDKKCEELQARRKEKLQTRLFALLCAFVAVVPALLVFIGLSLTVLIAPVLFMSLSIVTLLPVLLHEQTEEQGGKIYEQA